MSTREGDLRITQVAATLVYMYVANALYEMALRGDLFPSEDDDPEEHAMDVLKGLALSPTADVPIVRDVISAMTSDFAYNPSPIVQILSNGIKGIQAGMESAVTDEDLSRHKIKSLVIFTGTALKIPGTSQTWATGEHLYEVLEEGEDFTVGELIFGPERN